MLQRCWIFVLFLALLFPVYIRASDKDGALKELETKIYESLVKKDLKTFSSMLTEDAISIDPVAAQWGRTAIVEYLKGLDMTQYNMSDVKVVWFDKDCAAVTYKFSGTASLNGEKMPPGDTLVTTIWVMKDGKWLARFHQETPVMPMPATTN
jgi:uncharacterized protein (TIGR02246 family)